MQKADPSRSDGQAELRRFSKDWKAGHRWALVQRCITNDFAHLHGRSRSAVIEFLGEPDREINGRVLVYRCLWHTNPSATSDPGYGLRILVTLDAQRRVGGITPSWLGPHQVAPEDIR
jgi:hypothetical protein